MPKFIQSGTRISVQNDANLRVHDLLPVSNYLVKVNQEEQLYLDSVEPFTIPARLYGDTSKFANRIISTFKDRAQNTGVLLLGEKGSGKTLLAKVISYRLAQEGVPTILINEAFHGDKFNTLMQDVRQPKVVIFDEFEKVYDDEEQEAILTLLDGVFPSKTLFLITCNDYYSIDKNLKNRPGRIYYSIEYNGLEASFIEEYCEENLIAQKYTAGVLSLASMFSEFNFDMLKAVVEEINRYDEPAHEVVQLLNTKPSNDEGGSYAISMTVDGVPTSCHPVSMNGSPLCRKGITIYDNKSEQQYEFSAVNLVNVNRMTQSYVYQRGNIVVTFKRESTFHLDYRSLLA